MKILDLYITKVCNLHCDYCYVDLVSEDTSSMKGDIYKRIDLLAYDHIKFFGWEPLLRWELIQDIVVTLSQKKPNIKFTLITNGLLLSDSKIDFLTHHNIDTIVSFHRKWAIAVKKVLQKLQKRDFITISLIFETQAPTFVFSTMKTLYGYGFKNYLLSPEVYDIRTQSSLDTLKREILKIQILYRTYKEINICGVEPNILPLYEEKCHKTIIDSAWISYGCNRFDALKSFPEVSYQEAYDFFRKEIRIHKHPYRWWFVCPIWWYYDTLKLVGREEKAMKERVSMYLELNMILIRLHKSFLSYKHLGWFLTTSVSHIRFNLTQQCNIRCEYCYVDFKDKKLDISVATNIVDYFFEQAHETLEFSFFGWEPLLEFPLLRDIVLYIEKKREQTGKQVSYSVATNFLLMREEAVQFLVKYNFEVHISYNWLAITNDNMRDNSTSLLNAQLKKYLHKFEIKKVVILFAFSSLEIPYMRKNISYLWSLWFQRYNFELIFWDKFSRTSRDVVLAVKNIFLLQKEFIEMSVENLSSKKKFLDISTDGTSADNSLSFYGKSVDDTYKILFDTLLPKIRQ